MAPAKKPPLVVIQSGATPHPAPQIGSPPAPADLAKLLLPRYLSCDCEGRRRLCREFGLTQADAEWLMARR
jgi:hypothetical protein